MKQPKALLRSEHALGRGIRKGKDRVTRSGKGVDGSILGPVGTSWDSEYHIDKRRVGSKEQEKKLHAAQ